MPKRPFFPFFTLTLVFGSLVSMGVRLSASPPTTWKIIWTSRPNRARASNPPEAKAKIRESIHALNPDVLALEEMGDTNALLELRAFAQGRRAGLSVLGIRQR